MKKKSPIERFTEKFVIDEQSGCWNWIAAKTKRGYGVFGFEGKTVGAHVWAYRYFIGPTVLGNHLDHSVCDNPSCCNPQHLTDVVPAVNVLRGGGYCANAARKTHCHNCHEFTENNTYKYTNPNNGKTSRECRMCRSNAERQRRLRCSGV